MIRTNYPFLFKDEGMFLLVIGYENTVAYVCACV